MILYKFFPKFKFSKHKRKPIYEINPEEFILISEHLMNTSSTTHQLLGIIMASGIPLAHLKNQNIKTPHNSISNILSYILDSGLLLKTYSLVCSNKIAKCIENLDKKKLLSISAHKINYIAKKIFDFKITTKQLKIAYSLIVKSKETPKAIKYNSNSKNISLVKKPCILNLYDKLDYINAFTPIKPHKGNLDYYRNSMHKNTYTIANLISNFFDKNESCKNLYNLKLYINANLRKLVIYKNTCKLQKRIISKIFFLN
ncbi:hypothetical protein PT137_04495 (plasmid) [Borreliella garinii]|uniref:hypothetical protein n=1 Tax=Borreliella garinii TaxID=29519 RepID=UPI0029319336|nr:hypothetical protein [Borreliella garinii]WNZ74033.1 hypothetical protein PT142_04545 [Borreliella garinii]WNZ75005.1 hypothetical protein PT137_04495 [Borreliella garinii]